MKKPNLFIVGAAKAGTSSIYNYLSSHPDVYMSPIKEPNFFGSDIKWENFRDDHKINTILDFDKYFSNKILKQKHIAFVEDINLYMKLFRDSEDFKVLGEASTSYLYSSLAAKEIYEFNPSAKIIIILRKPLERTISHYLMDSRYKKITSENMLEDLIEDFENPHKGYCISNLYLDLSLYYEQIKRFTNVFPKEQVLVKDFYDLKNNPQKFMHDIFKFLNLNKHDIHYNVNFNKTTRPKNIFVKKLSSLKWLIPEKLKKIIVSNITLFYEPVSKDIANSDIKDYISKCTNDDWEKVNKFLKDN